MALKIQFQSATIVPNPVRVRQKLNISVKVSEVESKKVASDEYRASYVNTELYSGEQIGLL